MSKYKLEDLIGKKFGMLTITGPEESVIDKRGNRIRYIWCKCDCGTKCKFIVSSIMSGNAKSCGCQMRKARQEIGERRKSMTYSSNYKHGMHGTKIWHVWDNMLSYCYNRNSNNYHRYGARNITVCDEWRYSFENFYNWAITNGYREGEVKLDRLDSNGNFSPANCRWIGMNESHKNSDKRYIEYQGSIYNISETANILGCDYELLSNFCRNNYQYHDLGEIVEHANFLGYHKEDRSQDALIFINNKSLGH